MIKYLDNILLLFLFLIPITLITGPFLPDLFVSLSAIIFLIIVFLKKEYKYFNNIYFKFFILFWLYIILISFFSEDIYYSLSSSLVYVRFIIFSLSIWYLLDIKTNVHFTIFISLILSFILVLSTGYLQYFFNTNFSEYIYDGKRLTGLFGKEQILGSYLSRIYPFFLALLFFTIKKPKTLIFIFLLSFILIDVLIFLSGERTAFVYLIILSFLTILCLDKFKLTRLVGFIISSIIIFFVVTNDSVVKNRMVDNTLDNLNFTNKYGERVLAFSPAHESIFKTSLKIYRDNPVLGIGVKMFRIECKKEKYYHIVGCRNHPHNTYIQLLLETGPLGFLFFFSIFIFLSILLLNQSIFVLFKKQIIKSMYKFNNYQICLIIAIFISLWPIAPTGNFFHNWLNVIYFLPVGFLLNSIYKK